MVASATSCYPYQTMLELIRTHWTKISRGLMVGALLGLGSVAAYQHFSDDCCETGGPCCYPGSPCCAGKQHAKH
jgi:hypothetical protein